MSSKTFYESDFYRIDIDVTRNLLQANWLRNANTQEIEIGGTKLYEALRDSGIERVIANAEALGSLSPDAKEWMSVSFYRLLSETKLKKLARILPKSVFHQIALGSVITRAEALGAITFEVKNFSAQADALDWLLASD